MKALSYNFVPTVITIILLTILPIGYAKDIEYSTFIYTETSIPANLTNTQPRVWDIKHYQDSTTVLRISRDNYSIGNTTRCFEQKLILRVIQTNGSVISINVDDIEEIQDINYCLVNAKSPIDIYPLFDQYILITYIHASNTSDNTTFMDRGMVINWNGGILSKIEFGSSYLLPGTNIWIPNDYITVNIDPRKGFLRFSTVHGTNNFKWTQYELYDELFTLLQNGTVKNLDFTNFQVSVLPTLSYGYAIIYTNSTNKSTTDPSSKSGGLYVLLLDYNPITTSQSFPLYEISTQDVVFTRLICSIDYIIISHVCVLAMEQEGLIPVNEATLNSTVNFTFHLYNEDNKPSTWEFLQKPIISNLASSYDILPNNTMLVAQNETTTAWNLLVINLPQLGPFNDSGYDMRALILRLTTEGTQYFRGLNGSERHDFFVYLINELTVMIPIEEGRLNSSEHSQFDPDDAMKIRISISISETKDSDKMTISEITTNLDQLIKNKAYTGISTDYITNYLDETYGFTLSEIPQLIIQIFYVTVSDIFGNQGIALLAIIGSSLAILSNIV
ncbi:22172_t:CDS:2, partial [Gigaspora margarita]